MLKLIQKFWRRRFLNHVIVFGFFTVLLLSPLRQGCACPFIWTNLNFLHALILFFWPAFVEIGQMILKRIKKCHQCNLAILLLSLHKKSDPLSEHLNLLQLRIHSAKFGKIGPMNLMKKICKYCRCIFAISDHFYKLSFLGEGCCLLLERNWVPFTQRCFVARLYEIGTVVWRKCKKFIDRRTMDNRQRNRKRCLSFQLSWTKNQSLQSQ